VAEEGGGVARDGQDRAGGQLGGVEMGGEREGVDPQVDLEGGVGALEADVVGGQLQRVGPVDRHLERFLAQPADAVIEGPVADRVRDRGQLQVLDAQGGEDPDHHDPAAVPGGGPAHDAERLVQLAGECGEGPALERRWREVELQVEPVDLQDHPRVGGLGPHHLVQGQGATLAVDQEQLQLGAQRGRTGPEARSLQQPAHGQQALVKSLLEAPVVHRVKLLTVDRQPHRIPARVTSAVPAARR